MISVNKKSFFDLYENWRWAYPANLEDKEMEAWFDACEEAHQKIREKFGCVSKVIKAEIEPEPARHIPLTSDLSDLVKSMTKLIQPYFTEYGIDCSYLAYLDTACISSRKPIKWGKHINHWMERNHISEDIKKSVNELCSKLGEMHSALKVKKDTYYLHLVTHPFAFVKIGNYGTRIDHGSCFGANGSNRYHKFFIGSTENTFVGFVSKEEAPFEDQKFEPLNRFFGHFDIDNNRISTWNFYPKSPPDTGSVYATIHGGFKELLQVSKVAEHKNKMSIAGAYYNRDSRTFLEEGKKLNEEFVVVTKDTGVENKRKCNKCGIYAKCTFIDDSFVCAICVRKCAKICAISGVLSCNCVRVRLKDNHDEIVYAKSSFLQEYCLCEYTRIYCHRDNVKPYHCGGRIDKRLAKSVCKSCGRYALKDSFACGYCSSPLVKIDEFEQAVA